MSDTPRTDAAELPLSSFDEACVAADTKVVYVAVARQLERELAAAQSEIEKLKTPPACTHSELHGWVSNNESDSWCAKCGKRFGPNKSLLGKLGSSL